MIWGVLAQWLVRVVGVVLVGVLTLAFWHLLDLTINRRRNLMHVAGPRPLPILGRHRADSESPDLKLLTASTVYCSDHRS